MEKIRIYGLGNEGEFNYYILEKRKGFFEIFYKLFDEVFNVEMIDYKELQDKKGKWIQKKRNIEDYKDVHESVNRSSPRIDIFYGNKKIFLTIVCPLKLREKFNDKLKKVSYIKEK